MSSLEVTRPTRDNPVVASFELNQSGRPLPAGFEIFKSMMQEKIKQDGSLGKNFESQSNFKTKYHPTAGANVSHQSKRFYKEMEQSDRAKAQRLKIFHEGIINESTQSIFFRIAPYRLVDDLYLRQRTYRFNYAPVEKNPYETLPNFVTYDMQEKDWTFERVAVGIRTLGESIGTELGAMLHAEKVKQVKIDINTSAIIIIQVAVITAHIEKDWHLENSTENGLGQMSPEDIFHLESRLFLILQIKGLHLTEMMANIVSYFNRHNLNMDLVILPPGGTSATINAFTREKKEIETLIYTPDNRLKKISVDSPVASTENGWDVIVAPTVAFKTANLSTKNADLQGAYRNITTVAEYYTMKDPSHCENNNLDSCMKDIQIYSFGADKWKTITLLSAWENCKMFEIREGTNMLQFSKEFHNFLGGLSKNTSDHMKHSMGPLVKRSEYLGNQYVPVHSVADIQGKANDHDNIIKVVNSLMRKIDDSTGGMSKQQKEVFSKGMSILKMLDDSPYDQKFMNAFMKANPKKTKTDSAQAKIKGHLIVTETATNMGSFNLPQPDPTDNTLDFTSVYGCGLTTFEALKEIGKEIYKPNSHYKEIAHDVMEFVNLIRYYRDSLVDMLPHSGILESNNVPIWTQSDDVCNNILIGLTGLSPPMWYANGKSEVANQTQSLEGAMASFIETKLKEIFGDSGEGKVFDQDTIDELLKIEKKLKGMNIYKVLSFLKYKKNDYKDVKIDVGKLIGDVEAFQGKISDSSMTKQYEEFKKNFNDTSSTPTPTVQTDEIMRLPLSFSRGVARSVISDKTIPVMAGNPDKNFDSPILNDDLVNSELIKRLIMAHNSSSQSIRNHAIEISEMVLKPKSINSSIFSVKGTTGAEKAMKQSDTTIYKLDEESHQRISKIMGMTDGIKKLFALSYLLSTNVPETIRVLISHHIWVPFDIIIVRPNIMLTTGITNCLSTKSIENGPVGHTNYMPGIQKRYDDVYDNMEHFYFWDWGVSLENPENVFNLRNSICFNVLGGFDTNWIKKTKEFSKHPIYTSLRTAINFKNKATRATNTEITGDIFSVIVEPGFEPERSILRLAKGNNLATNTLPCGAFYDMLYGFSELLKLMNMQNFTGTSSRTITLAGRGDHLARNKDKDFKEVVKGIGHLRGKQYTGAQNAFMGREAFRSEPLTAYNL